MCNYPAYKYTENENAIIKALSDKVDLTRCKNNHKVFVSKKCPFCGEEGNRVFRYHTKLKVGKAFCCGASFKELYWLERQLSDSGFIERFNLENKQGMYAWMSDSEFENYKQYLEDKLDEEYYRFVKSDSEDDLDLPF